MQTVHKNGPNQPLSRSMRGDYTQPSNLRQRVTKRTEFSVNETHRLWAYLHQIANLTSFDRRAFASTDTFD